MFPQWMTNLLRYYDLWGLRTELKVSPRYRKFVLFIITLHMFLVAFITAEIIKFLFKGEDDTLGTVNEIIKYAIAIIVYWSIVIESNFKYKIIQ